MGDITENHYDRAQVTACHRRVFILHDRQQQGNSDGDHSSPATLEKPGSFVIIGSIQLFEFDNNYIQSSLTVEQLLNN